MLTLFEFLHKFVEAAERAGEIQQLLIEMGDQEVRAAARQLNLSDPSHPREAPIGVIAVLAVAYQRYESASLREKSWMKKSIDIVLGLMDARAAADQLKPKCDLQNRLVQTQCMAGRMYLELGNAKAVEKCIEDMDRHFKAWCEYEHKRIMWASHKVEHDAAGRKGQVEDPEKRREMEKEFNVTKALFEQVRTKLISIAGFLSTT